jgi:hypothetical protein
MPYAAGAGSFMAFPRDGDTGRVIARLDYHGVSAKIRTLL